MCSICYHVEEDTEVYIDIPGNHPIVRNVFHSKRAAEREGAEERG